MLKRPFHVLQRKATYSGVLSVKSANWAWKRSHFAAQRRAKIRRGDVQQRLRVSHANGGQAKIVAALAPGPSPGWLAASVPR